MYKLVSTKADTRWSFLDGYHIFGNIVYLMDKEEVSKYSLVDKNFKKLDVKVDDYIIEE